MIPAAACPATCSKCAVSPRITQPRQITASWSAASACAASGISNAPGHPRHVDVAVGDAGRGQAPPCAGEQPQRDVAVEAGGDDGDAQAGTVEDRLGDVGPADVLGHQPVAPAGEMSSPTRSTICSPNPSRPP